MKRPDSEPEGRKAKSTFPDRRPQFSQLIGLVWPLCFLDLPLFLLLDGMAISLFPAFNQQIVSYKNSKYILKRGSQLTLAQNPEINFLSQKLSSGTSQEPSRGLCAKALSLDGQFYQFLLLSLISIIIFLVLSSIVIQLKKLFFF